MAHLLGFRFAPRIPNLAERRLYAFGPASNLAGARTVHRRAPDEKLITTHWDDVLRLATSVRTGTVSASLMLKRLGAYPRQNGLALALREIGRIERTLYTLDWLEQPPLGGRRRRNSTRAKAATRWPAPSASTASAGCATARPKLQQHRASGLALVTAAIALWNTVYLGRALDDLRRRSEMVPDALLAHLAPTRLAAHQSHRRLSLGCGRRPGPDGFRALARQDDAIRRCCLISRSVPPTVLSCPFYGVTPIAAAVPATRPPLLPWPAASTGRWHCASGFTCRRRRLRSPH